MTVPVRPSRLGLRKSGDDRAPGRHDVSGERRDRNGQWTRGAGTDPGGAPPRPSAATGATAPAPAGADPWGHYGVTRDQALAQRPQVRFPPHVAGPLTGTVRQVDWAKALSATAMKAIDIHVAARMAQQPDEASRARMATAFGGAYRRLSDHSRAAKFWIDNKDTPAVALLHAHVSPSERGVLETMGEQIPASTSVKGLVTGRFRASPPAPPATSVAVAVPGTGAPARVATPPVITPPVTPRYTAQQLASATVAELDARAIENAMSAEREIRAKVIYGQINRDGVKGETGGFEFRSFWEQYGQGGLLAPIAPAPPPDNSAQAGSINELGAYGVGGRKYIAPPPPDEFERRRDVVREIEFLLQYVSDPRIPDPKQTWRVSLTDQEKQAMVMLGIRAPTPLTHDESFDWAISHGDYRSTCQRSAQELLRPYIPARTVGEQYRPEDINPPKVLLQKRLAQLGLAPKCTRCKGTGMHSLDHHTGDRTCWACNHASDRSSHVTGKGQSPGSGYRHVVVTPATLVKLQRLGPEIAALRQSPEARMRGFQLNADDIRRFAIGREHVSDTDAFVPLPATS